MSEAKTIKLDSGIEISVEPSKSESASTLELIRLAKTGSRYAGMILLRKIGDELENNTVLDKPLSEYLISCINNTIIKSTNGGKDYLMGDVISARDANKGFNIAKKRGRPKSGRDRRYSSIALFNSRRKRGDTIEEAEVYVSNFYDISTETVRSWVKDDRTLGKRDNELFNKLVEIFQNKYNPETDAVKDVLPDSMVELITEHRGLFLLTLISSIDWDISESDEEKLVQAMVADENSPEVPKIKIHFPETTLEKGENP